MKFVLKTIFIIKDLENITYLGVEYTVFGHVTFLPFPDLEFCRVI